ncbi:hypothetical protein SAMN05421594_1869 [Chryseobacterium oleae]|uniref:Uncharacterized protein n=1 Tax=Chryseobacterium oleae TaxID=491207 RepID=A0A1I4XJ27_CHROL|nr:hypothetical protein [Chryseobacterium oleae]SFN25503.1 hypothetical protein SAMN05421594_1869 [Chryseobacterium oleae]
MKIYIAIPIFSAFIFLDCKQNSTKLQPKTETTNTSAPLQKIDGKWTFNCNSKNSIVFLPNLNSAQFTITGRFSMNAELKKIGVNKYELYFTDFPPIIPLPDEMQNWENLDNKKAVGTLEIINESKINLTWFGFYYRKEKNIYK